MRKRQLSLTHLIIFLCLSVFAFSTHSTANQKDGLLKIYFLDIGQGDSILIETPSGRQILVDGGPDNKVLEKLGQHVPFYDHDIDVVLVSHPHADHITGLIDVLDRYEVKAIVQAKEIYDSPQYRAWEDAISKEGAHDVEAIAGKVIDFGDGVTLTLLHPFESVAGTKTKTPHNDVVVAMIEYGSFRVLLTGDMESRVENKLEAVGADLRAEVLKVGHHGSKASTSDEFLNSVKPQIGFIEVGKDNMYHLPAPDILQRLENFGIKYYRTDVDGDTELISDGENYQIIEN